jgi:hypothetical protein
MREPTPSISKSQKTTISQITINAAGNDQSAMNAITNILCEISGSHSGEYEDESLLGYSTV